MIKFVYQNKPLGTGDAVLKTQKFIKDNFFLMLLPDDLIIKNVDDLAKIMTIEQGKPIAEAKGEGIGSAIFHEMKKEFPEIFWRSKSNNPINKFYLSMADGYQKTGEWDIFWMGINDYSKLNECINFAVSKQQTISY
mgnify:CR=1 FL=1